MPQSPQSDQRGTTRLHVLWRIALCAVQAVRRDIEEGSMSLRAGGVAFFAFLSAFPALLAVISVYGLVFESADVSTQLAKLRAIWPDSTVGIFETELGLLVDRPEADLTLGVVLGLFAALWSARKGASALLAAVNLSHEVDQRRSKLRRLGLELGVTAVGVMLALLTIALVAVVPVVAKIFPPKGIAQPALVFAPGILAFVATSIGLAGVYWIGPNRRPPPFRWFLPASMTSVMGMVLVSWVFSIAVQEFISLEKTYGSLGTVAATLLLFYACSWILLLGAELSGATEAELQDAGSVRPGTVGAPAHPGASRGASNGDENRPQDGTNIAL